MTTATAAAAFLATAPQASAADIVTDAVTQLKSTSVTTVYGASLSNQGEIAKELEGSQTAVVAIPDSMGGSFSAAQLAANIKGKTGGDFQTVIVVMDGSSAPFGVASNGNITAIYEALNPAFSESGDPGQAILTAMDTITSIKTITSQTHQDKPTGDDGGLGMVGGGSIVLALAAAGIGGAWLFKKVASAATEKTDADRANMDDLPEELKVVMGQFKRNLMKHRQAGVSNAYQAGLVATMENILVHVTELFARIEKRGSEQQGRMAAVSYIDTIGKLNKGLSPDYYLDILAHSQLWDNSEVRLEEVRNAASAVDAQLVQNIREVNASQDLNLKVALESLTRSMDATKVEDLFSPTSDKD